MEWSLPQSMRLLRLDLNPYDLCSRCSFSMMVKLANDGLLQANNGNMLVNDGEMPVNDGEMLVCYGDT